MNFIAGSRVRFLARFRLIGKLFDPGSVEVVISQNDDAPLRVPAKRSDVGVYFIDYVVKYGSCTVTFEASSGEFCETTYEILPNEATIEPAPVIDKQALTPRLDRAAARSKIMSKGIPFQDSWSDEKIKAILDGLESNERHRRVHRQ